MKLITAYAGIKILVSNAAIAFHTALQTRYLLQTENQGEWNIIWRNVYSALAVLKIALLARAVQYVFNNVFAILWQTTFFYPITE